MHDLWGPGKFSATPKQWDALGQQMHNLADSGAASETVGHEQALTGNGWRAHAHLDVTNAWNRRVWHKRAETVLHIDTPEWHRGSLPQSSVDLPCVLLEDANEGWSMLAWAGHFPAHPEQERARLAAVKGLKDALDEQRREWKPDELLGRADWNLELTLPRNRTLIEYRDLHLVIPSRPTHGQHTIDGWLTTMRGTARTLPKNPGFDHAPVLGHFRRPVR